MCKGRTGVPLFLLIGDKDIAAPGDRDVAGPFAAPLDHAGHCEDQDPARLAVPLEDLANLADGGARGEDVVHQDEILTPESPRLPEAEGVADISPSRHQVESGLGQRRTRPAEAREHRKVQSSSQGSSQQASLVESPFSPAPRMGRDRHQAGRREGIGPCPVGFLEQGRQRMRQSAVAGELEAMDQFSQGSGVRSPGPGRVMEGSLLPAVRAGSWSPGISFRIRNRQLPGGCRQAAYRTEAAPEPGHSQKAFGTKGAGVPIGDPAAA